MSKKFEDQEAQELMQEAKDVAKRDWQRKAYNCTRTGGNHDLLPIEWDIGDNYKRVTRLMCKRCFYELIMVETIEHRN